MADSKRNEDEKPPQGIGPDDWPAQVADQIVERIGKIRSYTTDNVVRIARAAVYGPVAMVAATALIVLLTILTVRLADAYLPIGAGVGSATWAAHGFVGLLVIVGGFGAWRARSRSNRPLWVAAVVDVALIVAVVFYGVIKALV